jgi:hypothetical protein
MTGALQIIRADNRVAFTNLGRRIIPDVRGEYHLRKRLVELRPAHKNMGRDEHFLWTLVGLSDDIRAVTVINPLNTTESQIVLQMQPGAAWNASIVAARMAIEKYLQEVPLFELGSFGRF